MSESPPDRSFERWALGGACVLAVAGIVAFAVRKPPPPEADSDPGGGDDVVRVRIGGERPPRASSGDDPAPRVVPDPAPRNVPPKPVEPTPPPSERTIVVQPGETLGQIAQRELGTVARLPEILELNEIKNADEVRAGTKLRLPPR